MCAKCKKMSVFYCLFMYFLVSISPWLSHIHYVFKVPSYSQQQFFVIHPLVIYWSVQYLDYISFVILRPRINRKSWPPPALWSEHRPFGGWRNNSFKNISPGSLRCKVYIRGYNKTAYFTHRTKVFYPE